jgi:fatty-acyl-CoA synthase
LQTLPALAVGAKVSLLPRFDPADWFDAVEQWKPTTTLLLPQLMQALVEHARWTAADMASLRSVTCTGQRVPQPLGDAFAARGIALTQVYGSAETGALALLLKPDEAQAHAGGARAALGVQLKLATDGELLLKGPGLTRGYHRSADTGFDRQGWFHSGDLARRRDDGLFELMERRAAAPPPSG